MVGRWNVLGTSSLTLVQHFDRVAAISYPCPPSSETGTKSFPVQLFAQAESSPHTFTLQLHTKKGSHIHDFNLDVRSLPPQTLEIIQHATHIGKEKRDLVRATFCISPTPANELLPSGGLSYGGESASAMVYVLSVRIQVRCSAHFRDDYLGRAMRLGFEQYLPQSLRLAAETWSPRDFYDNVFVPERSSNTVTPQSDELEFQLLPFQQRAVCWMLEKEKGIEDDITRSECGSLPYDFVRVLDADGKQHYISRLFGVITDTMDLTLPVPSLLRGGILSEEMGLGKTVETIALICLNKQQSPLSSDLSSQNLVSSRATLVITPPAILQQWENEIATLAPKLKFYHYEGVRVEAEKASHEDSLRFLSNQDIVLTTFNVLAKEIHYAEKHERNLRHEKRYAKRESLLTRISWWRVVLDEAQMIEGGTSNAARVATLIPRVNAWCVSGTPVKKDFNDIYGLLLFLRYRPYCDSQKFWGRLVLEHKPVFKRIIKQLTLRHNKDQIKDELSLPAQKRIVITVPFSHIEEQHYASLFQQMASDCGLDVKGAPLHADWDPNSSAVVGQMRSWLTRLRQTCLHPEVGTKNRRALGGRGPLRTVNEVLEVMIEQNQSAIRAEERNLLLSQLKRGQILEHADCPQDALDIWLSTLEEVETIVKESRTQLNSVLQLVSEPSRPAKDDGEDEIDDTFTKTLTYRARLRSALELEHMCVFFTGNAYFQLKEAEHKRLIERADVPRQADPGISEVHQACQVSIDQNVLEPSSTPQEQSGLEKKRTESQELTPADPKIDVPKSELYIELERLEEAAYDRAKLLREELLVEARAKADLPIQKVRKTEVSSLEISTVPTVVEHGGIESRKITEKLEALIGLMRNQARQITEWREKTATLLSLPLVDESDLSKQGDSDAAGKEYETSTKQQDESYVYVDALHALVSDRHDTLTGQRNFTVDSEMKSTLKAAKEERWDCHAPELLKELWKIRDSLKFTDKTDSVRGLLSQLRELKLDLRGAVERGSTRAAAETLIINKAATLLQNISTEQSKIMVKLNREVELFKETMNLRVEYYRQLQAISDSVAPYEKNMSDAERNMVLEGKEADEDVSRNRIATLKSRVRYLSHLRVEATDAGSERLCIICQSQFENGILTSCGHTYCMDCLKMWWGVHRTCPTCKKHLQKQDFHAITYKPRELIVEEEAISSHMSLSNGSPIAGQKKGRDIYADIRENTLKQIKDIDLNGSYGTKIDTIARHLLWIREHDPGAKSIIFSQYRDFLEVLGRAFTRFKIGFTGIDRKNGIEQFRSDPGMECFFLHAKAHSSGLNLVNATHVFLCEPLINTAIELQAIARVHRIGQYRETTVWMYLVDGTVEKAIYDISVQRRIAHMSQIRSTALNAEGKDGGDADTVLERQLEAANTAEVEDTPIADLFTKGSGGGEMVPNEDLWDCLFRQTPSQVNQGSEDVQREVAKQLGADAAEARMRQGGSVVDVT